MSTTVATPPSPTGFVRTDIVALWMSDGEGSLMRLDLANPNMNRRDRFLARALMDAALSELDDRDRESRGKS